MAIMRRRTFSPNVRRAGGNTLRPVEWIRVCSDLLVTASPDTVVGLILVNAAEFDDFTRPTLVRTIGHLQLEMPLAESSQVAIVTAGITMINPDEPPPDPFLQRRGNRWLWWHCRLLRSGPVAAPQPLVDGVSFVTIPFDIKSMRKRLVDGSQLQLVVKSSSASTGDVNMFFASSALVKE